MSSHAPSHTLNTKYSSNLSLSPSLSLVDYNTTLCAQINGHETEREKFKSQMCDLDKQLKDCNLRLQASESSKESAASDACSKLKDAMTDSETRMEQERHKNTLLLETSKERICTLEEQLTSNLTEIQANEQHHRQSEVSSSYFSKRTRPLPCPVSLSLSLLCLSPSSFALVRTISSVSPPPPLLSLTHAHTHPHNTRAHTHLFWD